MYFDIKNYVEFLLYIYVCITERKRCGDVLISQGVITNEKLNKNSINTLMVISQTGCLYNKFEGF